MALIIAVGGGSWGMDGVVYLGVGGEDGDLDLLAGRGLAHDDGAREDTLPGQHVLVGADVVPHELGCLERVARSHEQARVESVGLAVHVHHHPSVLAWTIVHRACVVVRVSLCVCRCAVCVCVVCVVCRV